MEPIEKILSIRELEISITSRCTLACANCGFLVPKQTAPSTGEPITEIVETLKNLCVAGVKIRSLAILGGEPTIDGRLLERALEGVANIGIAERLEVVTNGLTPQGLTKKSLQHIHRLSISVYGLGDVILERYRTWISLVAPHVDLIFRMNEDGWDPWSDKHEVTAAKAQSMFDACWYRRHCTTVERGRLFVCSRIPKLSRDEEGLLITTATTLDDVRSYINRTTFLPACTSCTPMMGLALVPAGVQPDARIPRLETKAIGWLDTEIRRLEERNI